MTRKQCARFSEDCLQVNLRSDPLEPSNCETAVRKANMWVLLSRSVSHLRCACVEKQGVGVSLSRLPAFLLEHLSAERGFTPLDSSVPMAALAV